MDTFSILNFQAKNSNCFVVDQRPSFVLESNHQFRGKIIF